MICGNAHCLRRTFAEPFAPLPAPYARINTRSNPTLERAGLAGAWRAGARLASQLGLGAGRMTLLRRVMALPGPQFATRWVLRVDRSPPRVLPGAGPEGVLHVCGGSGTPRARRDRGLSGVVRPA
jgi:hypothetical protein